MLDLYAEQHDAVVVHELSDDDCRCDEDSTDDHDAVVRTIGVDHGKCVEVLGELVGDSSPVGRWGVLVGRDV